MLSRRREGSGSSNSSSSSCPLLTFRRLLRWFLWSFSAFCGDFLQLAKGVCFEERPTWKQLALEDVMRSSKARKSLNFSRGLTANFGARFYSTAENKRSVLQPQKGASSVKTTNPAAEAVVSAAALASLLQQLHARACAHTRAYDNSSSVIPATWR